MDAPKTTSADVLTSPSVAPALLPDAPPVGQIPPARPPISEPVEETSGRGAPEGAESSPALLERLANGAVRGVVAAMAMTGFREFTRRVGLLDEPPPEAIVRQRLLPRLRRRSSRHRATAELLHWGYGAAGGAVFAALPEGIRDRTPAGPLYGLAVWGGFEAGIAPLLELEQARKPRPLDRVALALDHALYGFVISGLGQRSVTRRG